MAFFLIGESTLVTALFRIVMMIVANSFLYYYCPQNDTVQLPVVLLSRIADARHNKNGNTYTTVASLVGGASNLTHLVRFFHRGIDQHC